MDRPIVRLAENADGAAVRALQAETCPVPDWMSYDNIAPYWLVAELPGLGIVGCIQTCPSRPIGRLEMLAVSKTLTPSQRGAVVRQLLVDGSAVIAYHGASASAGHIPFTEKGYKRALKKRGAVVVDSGNMVMRRLV